MLFFGLAYELRWSVLWTEGHGGWILEGILTTLKLSALGWIIACLLGILFGAMRTAPVRIVRWAGAAYVECFRNVPLLVWLFFWYFGAPQVLPQSAQEWLNRHGAEFWSAVAGLSVYHGARMAEVIRAGIQSIPRTQFEAAVSTGLSVVEAYRYVILPIAAPHHPAGDE